ncbi:MAG: hypothetical protein ACI8RD_007132, partial [Bacillariaceae sp.]
MHQFQVLISPVAKSQPLALLHGMHHHYLTFCKIITTHTRDLHALHCVCQFFRVNRIHILGNKAANLES